MEEKEFEEYYQQIIALLNQFFEEGGKGTGFVLLCGCEIPDGEGVVVDFRVAGAGDLTLLSSMMFAASRDDENYSLIFDTVLKMRKKMGNKKKDEEEEIVPLKLRPTIKKFGFK